jgi:hypothetical protein
MSVHVCLSIPELLEKIVSDVASDPMPLRSNINLFSLSTVCKSFSAYALDHLWNEIEGFEHILYTLPVGLIARDDNNGPVRIENLFARSDR